MKPPDDDLERLEIELLLTGIARRYGYDFRNYSYPSLRRRVLHAVELEQVSNIPELQARVLRDPECMERFIAALSVHVTSMFRDPEFYQCVRQHVIPVLRTYPFIRVWHAGCSTGQEVYSMAILLDEEGLYERSRLYATDLSDRLLEQAAKGIFPLSDMRENTRNYLRSGGSLDFSSYYTAAEDHAIFRRDLRRNMIYSQHNLVSDAPFNEFHLILCRNVMIYFDKTLRQRVHRILYESLNRFGFLALGSRESLEGGPYLAQFKQLLPNYPVYRKES